MTVGSGRMTGFSSMAGDRRSRKPRRALVVAMAVLLSAAAVAKTEWTLAAFAASLWRSAAPASSQLLHSGAPSRTTLQRAASVMDSAELAVQEPLRRDDAGAEGTGGYAFDEDAYEGFDDKLEPIGPVHYFGVSNPDGISIIDSPGAGEEVEKLMPGDVIAAEVSSDKKYGRLLDGRGWVELGQEGAGIEEMHPWAAQVMKKPGITKDEAASLGYLSMDEEKMPPLHQHLPLPRRVLHQLEKRGVKKASPIQEAVFADIHAGKSLCLQSQTGSGKTLAMALPLLTAMSEESEWGRGGDKIIIVASCRELAVQLFSDIDSMGFFPKGKGFATTIIVGNVPPTEAVINANVIIGTPNELGGYLHKDNDIIKALNTQLRGIILDEVDEYMTAPKLFASRFAIKRKRKRYNEQKATLSGRLGDFNYGLIEWFLKRNLAYSRRRDLQVLAASATMDRNMARKVFRMLRWDPLGRWYDNPPPLMRPLAVMKANWQAIPAMPTVPLEVKHRYVQVVPGDTKTRIKKLAHWMRRPYENGGLPALKVKSLRGQKRDMGARPVAERNANAMLDGLHDALKARKPGSAMVVICRSAGISVRDALGKLHKWGFYEAEAIHRALWTDPKDWPSQWAEKYTYDFQDHSAEIAVKHEQLNQRTKTGTPVSFPVGSNEWRRMEKRQQKGEATTPIVVGFEGIGRGIHFDGIETVYIVGLPQKFKAYAHYAGRVGRLGQPAGKVVSIIPKRSSKVLDTWAKKIGPGVTMEPEQIRRLRSAPVQDTETYRLPMKTRRNLLAQPVEKKPEVEPEPLLLPEPEDPLRMPGFDDEDLPEPEPIPVRDRVAEAARSRRKNDIAVRRIATQLQRATSRWPGPPKVPKHVTKHELRKIEKEKERKAK
eukprot:TRINITY_DN60949_c0_g1_i1.p1 TRINITY_DN60949_c0_g1~~TRINITY_DN60949_c0_g1_i1.p1  ORF type:complete len:883 (-),score=151.39 TRINITY_DN60949_c0_g1_i1:20-2668(-)